MIGIDCGCAYLDGRLGCLRLDDMQEFYSEPDWIPNDPWLEAQLKDRQDELLQKEEKG